MADRFPLIVDSTTQTIKELPSGDNLDLTGSSIVNASSIDVTGTVTADDLTVQSTATTRPTIGNSDVNTSGLTTGLNFEPISNISNGAKINVISGLIFYYNNQSFG